VVDRKATIRDDSNCSFSATASIYMLEGLGPKVPDQRGKDSRKKRKLKGSARIWVPCAFAEIKRKQDNAMQKERPSGVSYSADCSAVQLPCRTARQCFAACSLHNTTAATQVPDSAAAAISVLGVHSVLHLFVNKIPLVVHVKLRINGRLLS